MVIPSEVEKSRGIRVRRFTRPLDFAYVRLKMTRLLLATRNAHKTREFAQMLGDNFEISDLNSRQDAPKPVETGSTFAENAAIKALAISRAYPAELVLADDSGLEVDALGGAPGIFSARYAGQKAGDLANIEKLLSESRRVNACDSRARFVCALAAAKSGELIFSTEGTISGTMITEPRGRNGFGYDPVFVPEGYSETFAELPPDVKNRVSHRARAIRKLAAFLTTPHLPE